MARMTRREFLKASSAVVALSGLAGCASTGQPKAGCECVFQHLTKKEGIDSESKFKDLSDRVKAATQSPNPAAAMPPEFRRASLACRSALLQR